MMYVSKQPLWHLQYDTGRKVNHYTFFELASLVDFVTAMNITSCEVELRKPLSVMSSWRTQSEDRVNRNPVPVKVTFLRTIKQVDQELRRCKGR